MNRTLPFVLVAALMLVAALGCAGAPTPTPTRSTLGLIAPPAAPTSTPLPPVVPTVPPAAPIVPSATRVPPTPAPAAVTMYVVADGDGVMLRTDAACQNKGSAGLAEGTAVSATSISSSCSRVEIPGGGAGYVPAQYLRTAPVPTSTPRPPSPTVPPYVPPPPPTVTPTGCPGGCVTPPTGCRIKGNISVDSGEHIYHVPGQAYYNQTVIDTRYGERWFCTEAEAVDAGWRRSKQ